MDISNVLKTLQGTLELLNELEEAYVDAMEKSLGKEGKIMAMSAISDFDQCGCIPNYDFVKERIMNRKNNEQEEGE